MEHFGKDLLRLLIVIAVLSMVVYVMPPQGWTGKTEIFCGTIGGGVAAFFLFFLIRFITQKNKKK